MMHSFLLIGQSNMAGRGKKEEVEPIPNTGIYVMRNGRWWPMYVPVNPDRVTAGINLSESFAAKYLKEHEDVTVGLIPCADGGTQLDQWMPGEVLYDHAVMMTKLAMRSSKVMGILWHQGESDCKEKKYPLYEEKCTYIMESLRKDLGLGDIPLMLGGLGDFLADCAKAPACVNYPKVNEALKTMAEKMPNVAYVPAEGLGANPDMLHFSAAALREFGLRYYAAYKTLKPLDVENEKIAEAISVTEIEKL